ncbi:DUF6234 family protein [Streptomyces californicus]|uniref:DUF6234 family protein n=1 Tax=Streptomyces californicus TaxID=67351 RepID=UPI0038085BBB
MTDSAGRLPGRPGERSAARRPGRGADLLTGVLLVVAEAAAGALLVLWLVVRGMTRSHEAADGKLSAPPPADPGTDWTPIVAIGVFALVVACVAVALLLTGWHWSGGIQAVVAVALGVALLASAVQGGGRDAEEPAPSGTRRPVSAGATATSARAAGAERALGACIRGRAREPGAGGLTGQPGRRPAGQRTGGTAAPADRRV